MIRPDEYKEDCDKTIAPGEYHTFTWEKSLKKEREELLS